MTLLLGLATIVGGLALLGSGLHARRVPAAGSTAYLVELGMGADVRTEPGGRWDAVRRRIVPLLPTTYVQRLRERLETAGRANGMSAEELAATQVVLAVAGLAVAVVFVTVAQPSPAAALGAAVLLPVCGALGPKAWIERQARERQAVVRSDLPDVLDLLAISVEAGLGFDAALELAARNFWGALADELRRTLREMELGSSRRDALHAMKRRVDVPELSTFVVALTQADALGMPIGRVLHAQAAELRSRRRQWAREKAGKLPIKILFPLVGFIFPAILVVLLGPAAVSILEALR